MSVDYRPAVCNNLCKIIINKLSAVNKERTKYLTLSQFYVL